LLVETLHARPVGPLQSSGHLSMRSLPLVCSTNTLSPL
jgi:hypothetical protein